MTSKVILVGFLCIVLVTVVKSEPQYAKNEEAVYDESVEVEGEAPSAGGPADNVDDYEAIIAALSESFGTAADPGRRVGERNKSNESQSKQSDSSASDE